jgi:hypothetical protein
MYMGGGAHQTWCGLSRKRDTPSTLNKTGRDTAGELALKGGLQTQSHYQPVRLDRDVAKIREWVQWTRASRPISEVLVPYFCAQSPGTRPAWSVGPLGARPKPMCLGLCCRASRAELLLAFVYFISIFG